MYEWLCKHACVCLCVFVCACVSRALHTHVVKLVIEGDTCGRGRSSSKPSSHALRSWWHGSLCVHVCVCVCMCAHVCVGACVHVCVGGWVWGGEAHAHTRVCVCVCVYMCVVCGRQWETTTTLLP